MKKKHHKKEHHKKEHHPSHSEHHEMHHKDGKKKPKMWIAGAIKHPGSLRKELHVKKGHKIPAGKLEKASHAGGKEGRRARLAMTLKKLGHRKED